VPVGDLRLFAGGRGDPHAGQGQGHEGHGPEEEEWRERRRLAAAAAAAAASLGAHLAALSRVR
jgi:hypothetical protein